MTVRLSPAGDIALEGVCSVEDAETLQGYLIAHPGAPLDWSECTAAHTAVIQVLLAGRPRLTGSPKSDFLREFVDPLLKSL